MNRNKRLVAAGGACAMLLIAAGCSAETSEPSASGRGVQHRSGAKVDTSIFERAGGEGNGIVYDTPVEMARKQSVAVSGTVVGFADGYEELEHGTADEGYDIHDYNVVMKVKVDHVYKGAKSGLVDAGFVYLTMSRGAEQAGIPDDGGPSSVTPVEDFAKAIPLGSPIVVISSPMPIPQEPMTDVIGRQRGIPQGGVLLSGWHPQTMSFSSADGTNSWRGRSLAQVRQELDAEF